MGGMGGFTESMQQDFLRRDVAFFVKGLALDDGQQAIVGRRSSTTTTPRTRRPRAR